MQLVERFLLADVRADLPVTRDAARVWLRGAEMLAAFPLPGADLWRLMAPAPDGAVDPAGEPAVLDLLTRRLQERTGWPASLVRGAEWTSTFRIHRRLAQCFRQGRVVLAGDAAHIHSPMGGQGLNTGVGDAENLAWKLALVASGRAAPALLDSYEAERRPIAEEVLQSTSAMTRVVLGESRSARVLRDRVVVPSLDLAIVQRLVWERASQLGVSYRGGPLAAGRRLLPRRGPRPGDRVPDVPCEHPDGRSTRLHAVLGPAWVLLVVAPLTPRWTAATEACVTVARRRLGAETVTVLTPLRPGARRRGSGLLLVRPDAHLGWRGGASPEGLDRWLTAALGRGDVRRPRFAAVRGRRGRATAGPVGR